jgi:hypothetical protein
VWEEVTDNEESVDLRHVQPKPKAEQTEVKSDPKKAIPAAKSKKTDVKPAVGAQKSMMSFFTKK